ncbi:MAG TPA: type IX secretion system protein PorQ [Bacteroidales bacterium]|nr:type IX secretion system protein PorQ [Bacteroidales bacterium]HPT09585.1 type IX secretion system protein PorQ [Bacteroidales bacterium]
MIKKIHYILPCLILLSGSLRGQIGGFNTYQFLGFTNSARMAALGGSSLAVNDHDLSLTQANPSLIDAEMANNMSLSYVNAPGGINYGFVAYSHTFQKAGSFSGALQYINYGKFTGMDASENPTGDFTASEYALNIGWGRRLTPLFSIGANGKLIYSQLEQYRSFGIAIDVAGSYTSKDQSFTASLIAHNFGIEISPYVSGQRTPLPFELQIALSEKLKHIPLRFTQTFTNLNRWDLTYFDPDDPDNQPDPITGEVKEKTGAGQFADNFLRHIVLGAELTIAKVVQVRAGYNFQRHKELKLYGSSSISSGLSMGAGLRIKMFHLDYALSFDIPGKTRNYLTLSVNFREFTKKQ